MRAHNKLHDAQESRKVRAVAAIIAMLAVLAGGFFVVRTAYELDQQRQGILVALRAANAAKQDPAAMQLLNQQTVTANGRDYGGSRVIPNAADLFNAAGDLDEGTKQDLAWRLVLGQVPAWLPFVAVQSVSGAALATLFLAALLGSLIWLKLGGHVLEWGMVLGGAAFACWALEWFTMARAVVGTAVIAVIFAVLWRAVYGVLAGSAPIIAVARTTSIEGIRGLVAMGFALPIAVLLPILALAREPHQGLYQAIPGFLDWGHTVVYVCAALLVILFGCATTAFEIRDRQVWTVLTKPVSRLEWMLGKWLGAMALGIAVLIGGGLALYLGAQYLAAQPALDERDSREVRNAVLVGRAGVLPTETVLPNDRLLEIVNAAIAADPTLQADIADGRKDRGMVERELAFEKLKEYLALQRKIDPGEQRDYEFHGLSPSQTAGANLTFRYKLHAGADDTHRTFPLIVQFLSDNADVPSEYTMRTWTPNEQYAVEVDPRFIDSRGTLRLRLYNAGVDDSSGTAQFFKGPLAIYFDPRGIEVMYAQASFADNLARALTVDVAKIGFLAALAIAAATLLSFPVSVLLSFGIFCMASMTPFLAQSLEYYGADEKSGPIILAFHYAVEGIARAVKWTLSGFAEVAPSDMLAQGRVVTWSALLKAGLGIGVLWTGGTLVVGWLFTRRKEIAVYSGQG